jgi:hypothetical protein
LAGFLGKATPPARTILSRAPERLTPAIDGSFIGSLGGLVWVTSISL